jgi:probable HAF family extracellular repeat protein
MINRFIHRIWALFVAASFLPFAAATAQTYSVVDFYTVSGGINGLQAAAISAQGSIVVNSIDSAVVSDGVTLTFLSPLPGDTHTQGAGINANGQVAGSSFGLSGGHAFLYSGGSMTDLGTLPGGDSSWSFAINDSGQITGYATVAGGILHAFIYSNGTMTNLGTLPGGTSSQGNGINDSGVVVGQAGTAKGDLHAFVTQGNSLTDLGTLAGGTTGVGYTSRASAINSAGQIIGTSSVLPSGEHAFLYSGGKMTDLGTLGGNSYAYGINNSGQVVGSSDTGGAFLYANGVMTDLNSLIDPSDPMFGKVSLDAGVGINDSGWILVDGAELNPVAPNFTPLLLVPFRFSPRSLTFSNQPAGTQSAPQPITLTNLGINPLAISKITPTGGFTQTNDCPATLTNGSSCTIQVAFSPSTAGSQSGVLKVTTASTTFTLPVALSGSGYTAVSMKPSVTAVTVGMAVTLTWTSSSTTTCTATGGATGDGWAGTVPANGTKSVVEKAAGTYTYTLTCPISGTSPQASATVNDTAPGSSGGGGGMDWLTLGSLLSGLIAARTDPRTRARRS